MIFYIIALIVFGIALLVLEIVILPGLVAGIIGALFIIFSLSWIFSSYGTEVGIYATISTLVVGGMTLYFALKSKMWKRFSLNTSLKDSRMNEIQPSGITVGDTAVTLSVLRPMGTIMIDNRRYEAQTNGEMIIENTEVEIINILPNKLIVKLKSS